MKKLISVILYLAISISIFAQEGENPNNYVNQQVFFRSIGVPSNFYGDIKVQIVSVPFEGYTNNDGMNRYDHARFGCLQRRYYLNPITNEIKSEIRPISWVHEDYQHLNQLNWIGTTHTSAYQGTTNSTQIALLCGFAKYKFTLTVLGTGEVYTFYMDYTDSKYGKFNYFQNLAGIFKDYIRRFEFKYIESRPINNRVEMWEINPDPSIMSEIKKIDELWTENTSNYIIPDYKIWKLASQGTEYERTTPFEELFYIQGTPFPTSYKVAKDTLAEVSLYSTAVMDNILPKIETMENSNINTDMFYYEHPTIPVAERPFTVLTPGYSNGVNINSELGMKLKIENGGNLVLGENIKYGIMNYDDLECLPGSKVTLNANAKIFTGYIATPPNYNLPLGEGVYGNISLNGCEIIGSTNSKLEINTYAKLLINGTVTLNNVILDIKPGADVKFGDNARIIIKNGGNLIVDGCVISSSQFNSVSGIGFILENAGAITSITNCTFNSLTNPIYINSTTASASGEAKYIYNNTFNMDNSCNYVIETKYVNNITVSNNHINMQVGKGIGILMRYPNNLGNSKSAAVPYIVNVLGNTISNGSFSAAFICGTSAYAGINFRYNNCNGSPTYCNIYERQVTSDFKYNTITSNTSTNFEMYQSNQNVFSNTFNTSYINIYNNNSYPLLAPVSNSSSDGGWIWHGGQNKIFSTGNGNINYDHGTVALDWGQNCFLKNMNYNHLWGQIDEPSLSYKLRNNDFNNSNIPITGLFDVTSGLQVVPYSSGSDFGCNNTTNMGIIWQIRDLGNGLFDTLYKTSNNSGYQPPQDESIYSSALLKKSNSEFFDAISYFKALITGFPASSYTDACLYSLYECYQKLDTSNAKEIRDLLYTDLKNYFDGKILSGLYSDEFNFTAYNITMMCLASIADYNDAITGYEFISLYHPDAYLRLLASWDYVEVQALLNGSGGISSKEENLTDKASLVKRIKRVNKSVNEDPIKSKVKKSYDKIKSENLAKIKKSLNEKNNDENIVKSELKNIQHSDEMMSLKVNSVMRNSGHLTAQARDKNQIEDLLFSKNVNSNNIDKINTVLPNKYDLSQNYPNPFNPSTTIKYTLPNNGLVSIKIFDITGREVKTLVNEIKTAGNYEVDFNGSEFASGVYFYRMQSGNFVQTKRMVLIK